jgi:ribosomal protein S12 methylthiotransferase accessory factor
MASEVIVKFPGGKKVDALVDGMLVKTDQPVRSGGDGSAPSPFDLFAASLGACAGYYVLSFCQARSLPTEGVVLKQRFGFDDKHTVQAVELDIEVPESFPARYRDALVRAAEGCTVKRAIDAQPRFSVRAVETRAAPPSTGKAA